MQSSQRIKFYERGCNPNHESGDPIDKLEQATREGAYEALNQFFDPKDPKKHRIVQELVDTIPFLILSKYFYVGGNKI